MDVEFFRNVIKSSAGVISAEQSDEIASFNQVRGKPMMDFDMLSPVAQDWMRRYKGRTGVVLRPSTADDLSAV